MVIMDLTGLAEEAESLVLRDRERYDALFSALERICARERLKLMGAIGAQLIVGAPRSRHSYMYEVWFSGGYDIAKRIVQELYDETRLLLGLTTVIADTEFMVACDGRLLIKLYSQPIHHGKSVMRLIPGTQRHGYFAGDELLLDIMPEELIMIADARVLHNPELADAWPDTHARVRAIWQHIRDGFTTRAIGGGPTDRDRVATDLTLPRSVGGTASVWIGDEALVRLGLLKQRGRHAQIISDLAPDVVTARVSKLLGKQCTYHRHSISLPGDFQLRKWTIYAISGGQQQSVLELYNSVTYEIIGTQPVPRVRGGADTPAEHSRPELVGSYWTLVRFLLIDIWLLKIVRLTTDAASINRMIAAIAASVIRLLDMPPDASMFPVSGYVGTNIKESVMRKKHSGKHSMQAWVPRGN